MLRLKLLVEQNVFNFLTYFIFFFGMVAAILTDALANAWNPVLYWYTPIISAGTLYGTALCHYFHHRSASYYASIGDEAVEAYQQALSKNPNNQYFVGWVNGLLLLIVAGVTVHSFYFIPGEGWKVALTISILVILYCVGIMFFAFSKPLAEGGWSKK